MLISDPSSSPSPVSWVVLLESVQLLPLKWWIHRHAYLSIFLTEEDRLRNTLPFCFNEVYSNSRSPLVSLISQVFLCLRLLKVSFVGTIPCTAGSLSPQKIQLTILQPHYGNLKKGFNFINSLKKRRKTTLIGKWQFIIHEGSNLPTILCLPDADPKKHLTVLTTTSFSNLQHNVIYS